MPSTFSTDAFCHILRCTRLTAIENEKGAIEVFVGVVRSQRCFGWPRRGIFELYTRRRGLYHPERGKARRRREQKIEWHCDQVEMPAKPKAYTQSLEQTLDDIDTLDSRFLDLAPKPETVKTSPEVQASLHEAQSFVTSSRAFLARGGTLDDLGTRLEATRAAANELERGLRPTA